MTSLNVPVDDDGNVLLHEQEYYARLMRAENIGYRLFPHSQHLQEAWADTVRRDDAACIEMGAFLSMHFYLLYGEGCFALAEEEFSSSKPELEEINLRAMRVSGYHSSDTLLVPVAKEKNFVLCVVAFSSKEAMKIRFDHYDYWASKFGSDEFVSDLVEELRLHLKKMEDALLELEEPHFISVRDVENQYARYWHAFSSSMNILSRLNKIETSKHWGFDRDLIREAKADVEALYIRIGIVRDKMRDVYHKARQACVF